MPGTGPAALFGLLLLAATAHTAEAPQSDLDALHGQVAERHVIPACRRLAGRTARLHDAALALGFNSLDGD